MYTDPVLRPPLSLHITVVICVCAASSLQCGGGELRKELDFCECGKLQACMWISWFVVLKKRK